MIGNLAAFAVVFTKIALAVTQQRNVEEGRTKLIPAVSMVMQFVECATWGIGVHAFATQDWTQVFFMGLGAGTGSLVAMWVDRRWLRGMGQTAPRPKQPLRLVK